MLEICKSCSCYFSTKIFDCLNLRLYFSYQVSGILLMCHAMKWKPYQLWWRSSVLASTYHSVELKPVWSSTQKNIPFMSWRKLPAVLPLSWRKKVSSDQVIEFISCNIWKEIFWKYLERKIIFLSFNYYENIFAKLISVEHFLNL